MKLNSHLKPMRWAIGGFTLLLTIIVSYFNIADTVKAETHECNPDNSYPGIEMLCDGDIYYLWIDVTNSHITFDVSMAVGTNKDGETGPCRDVNIHAKSIGGPGCQETFFYAWKRYPRERVTEHVTRYPFAVAAINGDFFGGWDHGPEGLTIVDGERIDGGKDAKYGYDDGGTVGDNDGNAWKRPSLLIRGDGSSIEIEQKSRISIFQLSQELKNNQDSSMSALGGCILIVQGGNAISTATDPAFHDPDNPECNNTKLEPGEQRARTLVGVTDDGMRLLIAVTPDSPGKTLWEMASWMVEYGVADAINLDGGGSTQMWYSPNDPNLSDIFVPPSRAVANALIISHAYKNVNPCYDPNSGQVNAAGVNNNCQSATSTPNSPGPISTPHPPTATPTQSTSQESASNCPTDARDGVYLYADPDFNGACWFTTSDIADLGQTAVGNNDTSSVRVRGNYKAKLYAGHNFEGLSHDINENKYDSNVDDSSLGGNLSSVRVTEHSDGSNSDFVELLGVDTGKDYKIVKCEEGGKVYIDRDSTFTEKDDSDYRDRWCLQTANDDKSNESDDLIRIKLNKDTQVRVLIDRRTTKVPAWMNGVYDATGYEMDVSGNDMQNFDIYSCESKAGTITLGGPKLNGGDGTKSMYIVQFREGGDGDKLCTGNFGNSSTSSASSTSNTSTDPSDLVEIIETGSGRDYQIAKCAYEEKVYIDRDTVFTEGEDDSNPNDNSDYKDRWCLQTANDDKNDNSNNLVKLELKKNAQVRILLDRRTTDTPSWVDGAFDDTGYVMDVSSDDMGHFDIYSCDSKPGTLTFGGPKYQGGDGSQNTYIVQIREGGSGDKLCTGNFGNSSTSSTSTDSSDLVEIVEIGSGKDYQIVKCAYEEKVYIDRDTVFTEGEDDSNPNDNSDYKNRWCLQTANDDKNDNSNNLVKLELKKNAQVRILLDRRTTDTPSWVDGAFDDTGYVMDVSSDDMGHFDIYSCDSKPGTLTFGGPKYQGGDGAQNTYIVQIREGGNGDKLCTGNFGESEAPVTDSSVLDLPSAQTIYVKKGGNGDGTLNNPTGSIQAALDAARAGDTIFIHDGHYYESIQTKHHGTASARVTIIGESRAGVVLHGEMHGSSRDEKRAFQVHHDYITLENFTINGYDGEGNSRSDYRNSLLYVVPRSGAGFQPQKGPEYLIVRDMNFLNAGGECIRLKYFTKYAQIYGNNIQKCGRHYAFSTANLDDATPLEVDGSRKVVGEGIYLGTSNKQLDSKNRDELGLTNHPDETSYNLIFKNTFDTGANECVDIKEAAHHNAIYENLCTGQRDTESAGMESRGHHNIFRHNVIFDSKGSGIRFGGNDGYDDTQNSAYENVIYGNAVGNSSSSSGGIKFMAAPQEYICGNDFSNGQIRPSAGETEFASMYEGQIDDVCIGIPTSNEFGNAPLDSSAITSPVESYLPDNSTSTPTPTPGQGQNITIPTDLLGMRGVTVSVPVNLTNDATGENIFSIEGSLLYDAGVLEFSGIEKTGSLMSSWILPTHEPQIGQINIAGYDTEELSGNGTMFNLIFQVIGDINTESDLTWQNIKLNNGSPTVTTQPGKVRVVGLSISGQVTELVSGQPLTDVVISVDGPANTSATTDSSGGYTVPIDLPGNYTATPAKIGELRNAISILDAASILQCALGVIDASQCPIKQADVNLDGDVGAFDASFVARYLVGSEGASTGQWFFTPASRTHALAQTDLIDQNYVGYLKGDVTGNWGETNNLVARSANRPNEVVNISIPTQNVTIGKEAVLPLLIDNVEGQNILGYVFNLNYDATMLRFKEIRQADTLSRDWELVYNDDTPGELPLASYYVYPLENSGTLLNLVFDVISVPHQRSLMLPLNDVQLNEGKPDVVVIAGTLTVFTETFLPLISR